MFTDEEAWIMAIIVVLIVIFFFGIGYKQGIEQGIELDRREAIKLGLAERVIVDNVTGKLEFRWRTNLVEKASTEYKE